MKQNIRTMLIFIAVVLAIGVAPAHADRDMLQEALAQDVAIKLTDVTMVEALREIGAQAGIEIELSDEAIWKLPAGAQTRLSVELSGPLAGSLEQMLSEFFLRYAVGSDSVVIYPRPELRRILGRPTPRLLKLLKNIYNNKLSLNGTAHLTQLTQIAINTLADEEVMLLPVTEFDNVAWVVRNIVEHGPSGATASSETPRTTPVTLATILDETVGDRSMTWYISESEFPGQPAQIHIESRLDRGKALFGQIVDVSFENEEGLTVLRKLAAMANIKLQIVGEGSLRVDGLLRRISLDALNVTVREALNRVTNALGASVGSVNFESATYEVVPPPTRSGVTASFQPSAEPGESGSFTPAATPASDDDYVGKISIPMGEGPSRYYIEFMLRERDLPDGLRRLRAEKIREIFESFADRSQASQTDQQ